MSRHDYDHAEAAVIYIGLEPPNRTYAEVARRVGCNPATVAKWAHRYDWEGQLDAARQRVVAKALKTREQLIAQNARVYSKLLDRVEGVIDADGAAPSDEFVLRALTQSSRDYRLDIGEATDNVAVATVQAGFREAQQLADELVRRLAVDDGLAGEALVRAFRSSYPVQLVERLALIEGGTDA